MPLPGFPRTAPRHGQVPFLRDFGVYRFFLYEALARTRCNRGYLFVDTRDIFFQADVFASGPAAGGAVPRWWDDGFVAGLEQELLYDAAGAPTTGANTMGGPKPYHMRMVEELLGPAAREAMPPNASMACSGVLGGGGPSLRRFLSLYLETAVEVGRRVRSFHRWIPDQVRTRGEPAPSRPRPLRALATRPPGRSPPPSAQILLNYLVHDGAMRARTARAGIHVVLTRNADGPIFQTVWQLVRRVRAAPFTVRTESQATLAAVVHMFDRSPELTRGLMAAVSGAGLPRLHVKPNGRGGWG